MHSNALEQRHAELADQLTIEQRGVLAFLDGMLMERTQREHAAGIAGELFSITSVRARLHAAFPFLREIRDDS